MRAIVTGLAAAAALGLAGSRAHADPYLTGPPRMPDACNSGFYTMNGCGCWYGPNYCLRPPFPPFNGMLAIPQRYANGAAPAYGRPAGPPAAQGPANFATHPFARSPRDFFMFGQTSND